MKVVSPSYRRAGKTVIREWWPAVTLGVHASEAEEYQSRDGGDLLILPDAAKGNMARVRNAILDALKDEPWVLMVDDDIRDVSQFGSRSQPYRAKQLDADQLALFLENGCEMADDLSCHLWGINLQYDPKFYREYSPFSFTSPVLGPFCCVKPSSLRYDERLSLNEDYDFFLQSVRMDRKVLRFNRLHYTTIHLERAGGCASYRTIEEEKAQAALMQRKWGSKIVTYDFQKSFNPVLRVPIPGL